METEEKNKTIKEIILNLTENESSLKKLFDHLSRTTVSSVIIAVGIWAFNSSNKGGVILVVTALIIILIGLSFLFMNVVFGANKIRQLKISHGQKSAFIIIYAISYMALTLLLIIKSIGL